MPHILVVDDEKDLVDLLAYDLQVSGFEVESALTGRGALEALARRVPDLLMLDVMLRDLQGFEVLRILRGRERTRALPVILLTARGDESDRLVGFELGADDYVTKPFSPRQLLARVRAVLRRGHLQEPARPSLRFGELEIDLDAHRVFRNGTEVRLPPREYRLLEFLATHPDRVYPREVLVDQVWEADVVVNLRTVDVHVRRLRERVEADPSAPLHIETVRGAGYRFNARFPSS
ncbi:MAG: winged helix-turn-helix domain-containing protein [Proteobacteria bacterium]|nr:winged helix-turn-helix domain-containing protein [Pseudomonadota bacterium]